MSAHKLVKGNVVTQALQMLAYVASDESIAQRFIDETGQDPVTLASRAGDPELLAAVTDFISKDEPSLIACAAATGLSPHAIAVAAATLNPAFDAD